MNLSLTEDNKQTILNLRFMLVLKQLSDEIVELEEDSANIYSYMLTFCSQMLRIKNLEIHSDELFEQGIVDIINAVLEKGFYFLFNEILECLNLILSQAEDKYPESLFRTIKKLSDSNFLQSDAVTMYMRVYILMRLSRNKKSIPYFRDSNIVALVNLLLTREWNENIVPYCCNLLANISNENSLLLQILDTNLVNTIF